MKVQDLIDSLSDLDPTLPVLDEYGQELDNVGAFTEYNSAGQPTFSYVQLDFGGTIVSEELF